MRYTTVIDISEFPALYGNVHCRLLYLHMVLKAGYHDDDRDIFRGSIRTLAAQSGLTVSATRHALSVLVRANLLAKVDNGWRVTKWVLTPSITARPKNRKEANDKKQANEIYAQHERQIQQAEIERRKWLEETDFSAFVTQYEAIQDKVRSGRGEMHDNVFLGRNKRKYEEAKEQLEKKKK